MMFPLGCQILLRNTSPRLSSWKETMPRICCTRAGRILRFVACPAARENWKEEAVERGVPAVGKDGCHSPQSHSPRLRGRERRKGRWERSEIAPETLKLASAQAPGDSSRFYWRRSDPGTKIPPSSMLRAVVHGAYSKEEGKAVQLANGWPTRTA